jgi:hypothetical protein
MALELSSFQQSALTYLKQQQTAAGISISTVGNERYVESKGTEDSFSERLGALAVFMSPAMIKGTRLTAGNEISADTPSGTFRVTLNKELNETLTPDLEHFARTLADHEVNYPGASGYRTPTP